VPIFQAPSQKAAGNRVHAAILPHLLLQIHALHDHALTILPNKNYRHGAITSR